MVEFLVPATADLHALGRRLCESLELSATDPTTLRRTFYDTFDGRLYAAGRALVAEEGAAGTILRYEPRDGGGVEPDATAEVESIPRFAWDLPPSPLRTYLEELIEMRALLPQASVQSQIVTYTKHDEHNETVLRLGLEEPRVRTDNGEEPLGVRLRVPKLATPRKARQRALRILERDLRLPLAGDDLLAASLQVLGRDLAGYSSKIAVRLRPDERADHATKTILRRLLHTMDRNVEGMLADVDSEFLHDYRVSTRRTRTALSRIRGVLPSRSVERFKREFRWLGQQTGPARDADVYLLGLPGFRQGLPPELQDALAPLEQLLEQRKTAAYHRLRQVLGSARGNKLLADWRAFVAAPVPRRTSLPNAARPVVAVAQEEIWRAYRRVLKQGRAVEPSAPAMELHELRKTCKKLRYLIEFFRSLFPPDEIDRLVKELKRLQQNLGDVQDRDVQSDALLLLVPKLGRKARTHPETLMAVGALVQRLRSEQRQAQRRFARAFEIFTQRDNRELARELFRPPRDP